MDILKPVFLVLVIVQATFAAVTITTPANGDAIATGNAVAEDNTTAVLIETLDATVGSGSAAYAIVSIDGVATSSSDMFEIVNTDELKNKASSTFDYETKKTYVIIFTAIDGDPATATGTVTVEISDVDDQTSTFPSTCGYASADARIGDVVGNYYVSDGDVNSAITYVITGGDDTGVAAKFAMAVGTGILTKSAVAFDTATKSSYALVVEARGVVLTATTTITVDIGVACSGVLGLGASVGTFTLLAAFVLYQTV